MATLRTKPAQVVHGHATDPNRTQDTFSNTDTGQPSVPVTEWPNEGQGTGQWAPTGKQEIIPPHTLDVGVATVASADSLKATKPKQPITLTVAAMDALLPVAYGYQTLGGLLANVMMYAGDWIWWVWWCEGPIDGFDEVRFNDRPLNDFTKNGMPATLTNYLGGTDNVVNSLLVNAYAAQNPPITFNESLPGVAHSVIRIKARDMKDAPKIQAKLRGRRIYDPRQDSTNGGSGSQRFADPTTWTFSRNPALILADFLVSNPFGPKMSIDWPSVISVANSNDTLLGTAPNQENSRVADMLISNPATIKDWKETLRTAAGCFIVENQNTAKLVADVGGSTVASYAHSSGNIVAITDLRLADSTKLPTIIDVQYMDVTKTPWAENTAPPVYRPGADTGAVPWRRSTIPMPWIQSRSQAIREGIERMNKLWLRGLTFTMELFNEGLKHNVGDIISVDYPLHGLNTLPVKCVGVVPGAAGNWLVQCAKEDVGAYSNVVQANPTTPNTQLPVPGAPPIPTGLTWIEELYTDALGKVKSRMRAAWDDMSSYPYLTGYRIEVFSGATMMGEPTFSQTPTLAWGPVQENVAYTIMVYVQSPVSSSTPATLTTTAYGKALPPGDIPFVEAYESSGEVRVSWIPFLDADNPDMLSTEIRFGPRVSATWDTAQFLDFVAWPGQKYATRRIPPGDYRIFVKGHDSLRTDSYPNGMESVNAATVDVVVNGDPGLFIADTYSFTNPSLTNMVWTGACWITDFGTVMNSIFTQSPLNTYYPNVMATYAGSGTSELLTEQFDFGQTYGGTLLLSGFEYTDLDPTHPSTLYIETSTDNGVSWNQFVGYSAQASVRLVRVRLTNTGGSVRVTALGVITLSIVALTEHGEVYTSALGPVTVTLARQYSHYQTIQCTGDVSTGPANPGVLNVRLSTDSRYFQQGYGPEDYVDETSPPVNSFDVICYDGSNNMIANLVKYLFSGV